MFTKELFLHVCLLPQGIGRQRSQDSRWSSVDGEGREDDGQSVASEDTLEVAHEEAVINILRGHTMPVRAAPALGSPCYFLGDALGEAFYDGPFDCHRFLCTL